MMVMKLLGSHHGPSALDGKYLKHYDPDRPGVSPEGRPMIATIEVTEDINEAMHFADLAALHRCWTMVSTKMPLRHDGKPNRPLTAFNIEATTVRS